MAPFTHTSTDRPSRFSVGRLGVLYIASDFETTVHETARHHARFMAATNEDPGWVSQVRKILMDVDAQLHDIRGDAQDFGEALDPADYTNSQQFAAALRTAGSDGIAYPSVRGRGIVSGSSIQISRISLHKVATLPTIGTVRGLISSGKQRRAMYSGLWTSEG